ncbi:helix-turn-helix domain-containing protein [Paenibacillus sp. LHD-117]|uniref:helix-turn-helix domain-containing protein n=1 Tax=Paenibacillus sp. LHD-117 TaxID=3071412 RepID=UPI0027E09FF5|nr:helix-turn-helix domain-containing protein [Paenibacillus sp. LHD-117]MDQ6420631.1 helix-turn-helix domain-containing protein [Paenibacillus sp. LHD-117]
MLVELRLRLAESHLMRNSGTVKQVAFWVGFRDEHHFSKMYKHIRGITATEYSRRCNDPLFRHTVAGTDPYSLYPLNRYVVVNENV